MQVATVSATHFYNEILQWDWKIVIDCRERAAYDAGHVKFAFNFPPSDLHSDSLIFLPEEQGCEQGISVRERLVKKKRGFLIYGDEATSNWTAKLASLLQNQHLPHSLIVAEWAELKQRHPFLFNGCNCDKVIAFPNEIFPPSPENGGLYLSGISSALDLQALRTLNIKYIIDISHSPQCENLYSDFGIKYKTIKIDDNESCNISQFFGQVYKFIEDVTGSPQRANVLVHCFAGISRSATLVIAYLMKKNQLPLVDAYDYVYSCRKVISPNMGFRYQLLEWQTIAVKEEFPLLTEYQLSALPKSWSHAWNDLSEPLSRTKSSRFHCRIIGSKPRFTDANAKRYNDNNCIIT